MDGVGEQIVSKDGIISTGEMDGSRFTSFEAEGCKFEIINSQGTDCCHLLCFTLFDGRRTIRM